ncbi:MAG TPA: SDR family oxidoreductase [Dehalococcoidia bacterium]|nr:SDR family oxidoreductase [Dehalococcoidia bacterium]
MDLQLQGKRAVVTGGSRGIGKAIARALAREGVDCALCARSEAPLVEAAKELASETGRRIFPFVADMNDEASIEQFISGAASALGGIDILINNAARRSGPLPENLENMTGEWLLQDFQEKVVGYFRCAKAVAPYMKEQGWGRIINISGLAARNAVAISAGSRNVATVNLTRNLAFELGPFGVNVNALYPGSVLTDDVRQRLDERSRSEGVPVEKLIEQAAATSSLKRMITPEEIAQVVVFLASPLSLAITGQVIDVTGGIGRNVYY